MCYLFSCFWGNVVAKFFAQCTLNWKVQGCSHFGGTKTGKSSRSKDVYDLYTKEIPRILAFIVVRIVFFLFLKIENTWSWNILQDIPNTNARYNQENGKKLWIVLYLRDLWRLLIIYFSYELKMGRIWCQTQRKVKEIQMNHQPILLLMHLNICKL